MEEQKVVKAPDGDIGKFRVVKDGKDVIEAAKGVLKQIENDEGDINLFYDKSGMPDFLNSKEGPALTAKATDYGERYGVLNKSGFEKLKRRYRFIVANFQPDMKYEFTIDQLVELGF